MDTNNNQIPVRLDILQALINHAEHGITIAEREGDDTILLYVNKAFEEMTGYSSDDCLYKDCRFLQAMITNRKRSKRFTRQFKMKHLFVWYFENIIKMAVYSGTT